MFAQHIFTLFATNKMRCWISLHQETRRVENYSELSEPWKEIEKQVEHIRHYQKIENRKLY